MIEHIASYLNKDAVDVKQANLYKLGQTNLLGETLLYSDFRTLYQSKFSLFSNQAPLIKEF